MVIDPTTLFVQHMWQCLLPTGTHVCDGLLPRYCWWIIHWLCACQAVGMTTTHHHVRTTSHQPPRTPLPRACLRACPLFACLYADVCARICVVLGTTSSKTTSLYPIVSAQPHAHTIIPQGWLLLKPASNAPCAMSPQTVHSPRTTAVPTPCRPLACLDCRCLAAYSNLAVFSSTHATHALASHFPA